MKEIEREIELSKYLEEWANYHYGDWLTFYRDVNSNKRNGIYLLKGGTSLMNLLNSVIGNLEGKFCLPNEGSHLIPTQFASVPHLIGYLEWLKGYVDSFKPTIEKNIDGEIDNYIIHGICEIVGTIDQVVDRCVKLYKDDTLPRPYQALRAQLFEKDVDGFVNSVNGILKGIPYLSRKKQFNEGHFQTMLQMLLTVLGFEPIAEQVLSDGRIDMVVKMDVITYIFEFKYTDGNKSQAKTAMKQIKDKGYAEPYRLTSTEIIGVGVSFSGVTKNINGYCYENI